MGVKCTKKNIFCFYTNCDTLLNKRTELLHVIECDNPDIICLTEILPKNFRFSMDLCEIKIDGYNCFTNIQGDIQGTRGVVMYVREQYEAQQLVLYGNNAQVLESVWCEIPLVDGDKLLLGTMYRSPNSSVDNNNALNTLLREITADRTHVLVTGDFNYPEVNWSEGSSPSNADHKATVFLDTIRDTFLYQHVAEPTHCRGEQQPTLIDLVFTNEEGMVMNLKHHAPLGKSHHHCLMFEYVCYANKSDHKSAGKFAYLRGDYDAMRAKLASLNLENKIQGLKAQEAWDILSNNIEELVKEFVPYVRKNRSNKKKKPLWMSEKALAKVKKKRSAYQRYMQTREGTDYLLYAQARNQAKKACKNAVKALEIDIAKAAKSNPKAFYAYAKSKMATREGVSELIDNDGKKATTDSEKADMLNEFFCSVFTKENLDSVPDCDEKTLRTELREIEIDTSTVLKLLNELDVSKSAGPDNMHPRVLKELANVLAELLAIVFRASLTEGIVPYQWKQANVTPLFKKGSKSNPGNYRPVSLTSIPCKLMEKIIRTSVFSHLAANSLLSDCQHGFVANRSCVTNLISVIDDWTDSLDDGVPIDAAYLDFAKAFDCVPHLRLLKKLEAYGIGGHLKNWIGDFLSDRKQRVKVNGSMSSWKDVTSGVPQGSVLGPVLFVIYINDLPEVVDSLCSMYADDTKVYRPVKTSEDNKYLQKDLDNLVDWADKWQMRFNADKCKILQIGAKNKNYVYSMRKHGSLDRVKLENSSAERDLGVNIDNELKFSKHVETQVNKANRILGLIRRSYEHLDVETLRLLFVALVRPHLEFANVVWSPRYEKDKILVESVLRRATKCVRGLSKLSYEERLRAVKIPSMCYRRIRGDMIETYKFIHGFYDCESPLEFNSLGNTRGHQFKLKKKQCRTTLRQWFFTNRIIDTWNSLDKTVVEASTLNSFKNRLDFALKEYMYCPNVSFASLKKPTSQEKFDIIGHDQKIVLGSSSKLG